ncbi:MAG: hypothetical protein JNM26_15450 [Ideonella sp.]|nr:hypothetical protein [Ideonella sp.]
MNAWLLGAAALLGLIGLVHSVMGEQRIFMPWAARPPTGMPRIHRQILRGSWHLVTLLGLGQVGALAWLGLAAAADRPSPGLELALLACLAGGVLASGLLVMGITRGRHQGGTALVVVALLIGGGIVQAGAR